MRIVFDPELAWMEAYAEGAAEIEGTLDGDLVHDGERILLARFERPVLVTDGHRISQLPPHRRDVVQAFFGQPRRTIEYDGTALAFDQSVYPRVWSPSIDTLLLASAVRTLLPELGGARSLLEIGCGSGFLALHAMEALARAGHPLEEVHVVDIEPQALACATSALEPSSGRTLVTSSLGRRGDALRVRGAYDLVLMNPPYIRRPEALASARYRDNAWEGVALLREVAERGAALLSPGGSLLVVVSSLCDDLVMPWLEGAFSVAQVTELEVPLKVYAVTSGLTRKSRAWLEFLRTVEGLQLHEPPRDGYSAWHHLRILRCRAR